MNHSFLKAAIVCNVSFAFHYKKSIKKKHCNPGGISSVPFSVLTSKWVHKVRPDHLLWCLHYFLLEDIPHFRNIKFQVLVQSPRSLFPLLLLVALDHRQICHNPGWGFCEFYSLVIILGKYMVVWFTQILDFKIVFFDIQTFKKLWLYLFNNISTHLWLSFCLLYNQYMITSK